MSQVARQFSWRGFELAKLPEVPSWVEAFGRAGYIAKGIVYFIVGYLAFKVMIGPGGEIGGARNAIREIGEQPFGTFLLALMTVGLLGYTAWRFIQAAKDTEGAGSDAKGLVKRTGYVFSGIAYALLGVYAGSLALGSGNVSSGDRSEGSFLLDTTWGRILLVLAGVVTIGVAVYFTIRGYKARFMSKYALARMNEALRKLALHAGRFGLVTRGIAFAIIGYFLVHSAWQGTSNGEIADLGGALAAIASQAYGKFLLGIVGLGLMAYAVHCFLMGWYRRFNVRGIQSRGRPN